jgi:tripartite ATP-independent transporter DctM subunit
VLPAIIVVLLNLLAIKIAASLNKDAFPIASRAGWDERIIALKRALPASALMLIVFGGLYSGVFTVNEAASVAAVTSLVFAVLRGRMNTRSFLTGLQQTAGIVIMIYIIVIGANIFSYFMTVGRVPDALLAAIGALSLPPLLIIVLMLIFYLIVGAIFDEIAAMLITLPFALPVITHLGYDPLWWGVINVVIIELGMIIPPIGLIVLIIHNMVPTIGLKAIYRGVVPFILADMILLALLTLFPVIVLWLPRMMGY